MDAGQAFMFDRTLTERLEAVTLDRPYKPAAFDKSVLLDSVLNNLRRILNERRGSCETRLDYGIPDLNDVLGQGGTTAELAQIVQEMIRAFEPRLTDPAVRFTPDPDNPLTINFRISAVLHYGDETERVTFDTIVSEDKRVRVRG
jgi:type VI secretion system protein